MLLERRNSHDAEDATLLATVKDQLLSSHQSLTLNEVWPALRRLIGNGPGTVEP